ncbi:endolytic transglycosylase MltG [Pedococcus sp. KACC 23699]|uniref:Endolytic murein transglycosylase n=1 Tax=Pedococcus sp. KACC 23699 TaxID=3149228 RepID=A0AAU7JTW8_9MICO
MTKPHLEQSIFGGQHDGAHDVDGGTQEGTQRDGTRAQARARTRAPRRRHGRRRGILVVALVIVAVAGFAAYTVLRPVVSGLMESNDYPGPGAGQVKVLVKDGDTGRGIGTTLEKAGVVKSAKAFLDAASSDPRSAGIQPGTYTLKSQMSARGALAVLLDSANRTVPRVTIREGLWKNEVFAALSKGTGVPVAQYAAAAKDPKAIGLPAAAKGNVEGYLFPSTYEFPAKATATQQLRTMVAKTTSELQAAGVAESARERTLIIASIVEGEVSGGADRGKVARVIENRLRTKGGPNYGLLQMDSTVHYAVQKRGRAGTSNADRQSASPYNTYKRQGLPPAPINSPGAASIKAAASPTPGSWLFFVTVDPDTGETKFATTQADHDRNVQEFQAWCRDHSDRC